MNRMRSTRRVEAVKPRVRRVDRSYLMAHNEAAARGKTRAILSLKSAQYNTQSLQAGHVRMVPMKEMADHASGLVVRATCNVEETEVAQGGQLLTKRPPTL